MPLRWVDAFGCNVTFGFCAIPNFIVPCARPSAARTSYDPLGVSCESLSDCGFIGCVPALCACFLLGFFVDVRWLAGFVGICSLWGS